MNHFTQTPSLSCVLNDSNHPRADEAINELSRLREANYHLMSHLVAIKQQTDSSVAGIQSLLGKSTAHDGVEHTALVVHANATTARSF